MPPPALPEPGAHRTVLAFPPVFVDEGVQDLLAQPGDVVAVGAGRIRRRRPLERARDTDGVPQDDQLQAQVTLPGRAALQGEQAQLAHGQPEIVQLLNVEAGSRRHGARHQPGQHDEVAPRREGQFDAVAHIEHLGGLGHQAPAPWSESSMVKTLVSPVISKILTIRGSAITSCRSPPSSRQRLSAPTRTPSAVESKKVTESRSRATVASPSAITWCRHSRNWGAVATSISPLTATTGTSPSRCSSM